MCPFAALCLASASVVVEAPPPQEQPPRVCAIPLLEADPGKLPAPVPMPELKTPPDRLFPMARVKPPAPACGENSWWGRRRLNSGRTSTLRVR